MAVGHYLDQLYREFGYFRNELQYLTMSGILGKQQMFDMLNSLRTQPPTEVAGLQVTGFEDLQREDGRLGSLKGETDRIGRNVLVFHLGENARLVLRPSGTEPKAKAYVEVSSPPAAPRMSAESWAAACASVDQLAGRLGQEFVRLALSRVGLARSAT
jgi:phosphoglucomutase